MLKDHKLSPRIKYIKTLMQTHSVYLKEKEVERLISSIWPVRNSQALVYDGQFGPPEYSLDISKKIICAILKSSSLRYRDRYAYQQEVKEYASLAADTKPKKEYLKMLRKLRRWYPRDRYFAYLLASAYKKVNKTLRGILTLHGLLNTWDVRDMLFGQWIEVKIRLLLIDL